MSTTQPVSVPTLLNQHSTTAQDSSSGRCRILSLWAREAWPWWIQVRTATSRNGDRSKTATTKTATSQNGDKPTRRQPKRRQSWSKRRQGISQNGDNHWSKRRQPLVKTARKTATNLNGDNGTNQINEDDNCNFIRLMNCINIILIIYVVGITIGNKNVIISYPNYISIVFVRNEAICVGSLISVFMRCKPGSRLRMCSNVCYSHLPFV